MELKERMPKMIRYVENRVVEDNCSDCTLPKSTPDCKNCYDMMLKVYKKGYCGVIIAIWEPWVDWDSVKSPYRMDK